MSANESVTIFAGRCLTTCKSFPFLITVRLLLDGFISRVTSDTERVAELLTWGVIDSAWGIMNILTSMNFMLLINWGLA